MSLDTTKELNIEGKRMVCPKCKSKVFHRHTVERVEMIDDGEIITDELIDRYDFGCVDQSYKCAECETDVTDIELSREEVS